MARRPSNCQHCGCSKLWAVTAHLMCCGVCGGFMEARQAMNRHAANKVAVGPKKYQDATVPAIGSTREATR